MSGDTKKWMKILFALALAAPILAVIFSGAGPFAQFQQGTSGFCQVMNPSFQTLGVSWADPDDAGFLGRYRFPSSTAVEDRIPQGEGLGGPTGTVAANTVFASGALPTTLVAATTFAVVRGDAVYGIIDTNNHYLYLDGSGSGADAPTGRENCSDDTELSAASAVTPSASDPAQLHIRQGSAIAGNAYGAILVVAVSLIPVGLLGVFFFKILGGTVGQSKRRRR